MPRAHQMPWVRPIEIHHNIDDNFYSVKLDFDTVSGGRSASIIPRSQIDDPRGAKRTLAAQGARIPEDWLDDLRRALIAEGCDIVHSTSILGWHGRAYLFPNGAFGRGPRLVPAQPAPARQCVKGKTKAWREGLAEACGSSSYLTFAISVAFAGCLLRPVGQDEGAVFHFIGESSTGKSLASTAAQSVIEKAGRECLRTHDLTDRALEEQAAHCNDSLLVLDELGRIEGTPAKRLQHVQNLAYKMTGGQGRQRSNRAVSDFELRNLQYLLFGLSSGEELLDGTGIRRRKDGEQVRLIGISVPARDEGGVFDREPFGERRAELASRAELAICENYGRPIRRFIRKFLADPNATERAREYVERFMTKAVTAPSPFAERFARKFAVVYAAAMLAAHYKVAPWTKKLAAAAIRKVHRQAWEIVRPPGSAADDMLAWLCAHAGDSKLFPKVGEGTKVHPSTGKTMFGIRREISGVSGLALLRDRLPDIVPAWQSDGVLASLKARGYLLPGKEAGRYVRQIRVKGLHPPRRDYVVFDIARIVGPARNTPKKEPDAA